MFWRNGYEALTALDDDGNGWLEGKELRGIAVWCDKNGNGISDSGEVKPLDFYGITRISVRHEGTEHGLLFNPQGIQRANGKYLSTYDWISEPFQP